MLHRECVSCNLCRNTLRDKLHETLHSVTASLLSRKFRKLFGPEKPFQKLQSAYFKKLAFYYDFKIREGKLVAKFYLILATTSFLRYEGNYSTLNGPQKFRDFEKRLAKDWRCETKQNRQWKQNLSWRSWHLNKARKCVKSRSYWLQWFFFIRLRCATKTHVQEIS